MTFILKNAWATYQLAMPTLFHDMIHRKVKVYVDDVAKSKEEEYLVNLGKMFNQLRKY